MSDKWVPRFVHAALKIQNKVTPRAPKAFKEAATGRKAKMVIEGTETYEFYLRWTGEELVEELDSSDVRNDITLHSQTLLDLMTGELGVREAMAARLISVSGDRSLYDSEDLMKLLERFQKNIVQAWTSEYKSGVVV